ncbi:MAG: hypothetical protein OH319_04125 [Candidatus Parvarchaeota archaeon]|nr:hypothetical protein [Candidatus Jingweiarchaeum tengchongense]MCW1298026.1 hypothetical protein [Candidatus Jingweiarchaeum tengchongense]MCW1300174.1 hypothetical protein [Candidatus Jingweiarchaeum tengchongense]MCW1304384.1 hypothetical protein [Candidatus Jingweiarchaeum tengchongense]MCW1309932.1 hypothetical protein [Candidatus Jingweiarchaeum tengchongense]
MKKGVELPTSTIVIIIVALLVLVVALIVTGKGGDIAAKIGSLVYGTTPSSVEQIRLSCELACAAVANACGDVDCMYKSDYCQKTFLLDQNKVHCWDATVNFHCNITRLGTELPCIYDPTLNTRMCCQDSTPTNAEWNADCGVPNFNTGCPT